jgi:hypothetical protein
MPQYLTIFGTATILLPPLTKLANAADRCEDGRLRPSARSRHTRVRETEPPALLAGGAGSNRSARRAAEDEAPLVAETR